MVKKLGKFFIYFFFFVFALILFTPKESIYYLAEQNLKKFDVVISKESLKSTLFSLNIENLEITTKGIDSAIIEKADITLLLFSNNITLENIKLSSVVDSFVPSKISNIELNYTIFNPLVLTGELEGKFGVADVKLHILDRNLSVVLYPSKLMLKGYKKSLNYFTKGEEGEYKYAKTF